MDFLEDDDFTPNAPPPPPQQQQQQQRVIVPPVQQPQQRQHLVPSQTQPPIYTQQPPPIYQQQQQQQYAPKPVQYQQQQPQYPIQQQQHQLQFPSSSHQQQPPPQQQHLLQQQQKPTQPHLQQQQQQQPKPTQAKPGYQQQPPSSSSTTIPVQQTSTQQAAPAAIARPQQQQQQQYHVDPLASLIRARTKEARTEDLEFAKHVETCTNKPCSTPNCEDGKVKLEHYKTCRDPKCFQCVFSRLIYSKDKGKATPGLFERLMKTKQALQDGVRKLKKTTEDIAEANSKHDAAAVQKGREILEHLKTSYNAAKGNYELLCAEVFETWKVDMPSIQARPISAATAQQARQASASPAPPAAARPATTTTATTTPVPSSQSLHQQQPPAAPVQQQPLRKSEDIDGNTIEFQFGDTSQLLTATLERECEAFTEVASRKDDDWISHVVSDEKEPDWAIHNVLTKAEISEAEQRTSKRLFLSGREHEYISRAGQELVIDLLSDAVQLAVHRKQTNPSSSSMEVSLNDIKFILQKNQNLISLLSAKYVDGGVEKPF